MDSFVKKIRPINHPLAACVTVPGSKSHTNRALLLAALACGTTTLHNALDSEDTRYFMTALRELGFDLQHNPDERLITVRGSGGEIPAERANLCIGNAGTAARFLTALLTLGNGVYRIDGVARMRQRPIGDLVAALNRLGADVKGTPSGSPAPVEESRAVCPPVTILGGGLPGGSTSIRGDTSSQYLSGLLMVAPYARVPVEITVEGPLTSKPYIDLTLNVMADYGVQVHRKDYTAFSIFPQVYQSPGRYRIESDASAASYFFAAPAICGGWVQVAHISKDTRQGDIAFLDVLSRMGCAITFEKDGIQVSGPDRINGVEVDMADISDTSMTLAAIAPFAMTPTTIRGIASSRVKETDRITATCTELRRLGVQVDEHADGMTIYPCDQIQPARIRTYGDHRMAMAFSLVGLRIPDIEINDPDCVAKTFPDYFQVLDSLR
jgi:3-phosphoshikimate 1-carboxyvinyltransferase